MLAFIRYWPKSGIRSSSRFSTKNGASKKCSSEMVSHIDWCLAATIRGPFGIFSTPRYSILMLQMMRIIRMLLWPHQLATRSSALRGITSVGSAMIAQSTKFG